MLNCCGKTTTNQMKNMKILMVCMGNICRSPMAEGIARHLLAQSGKKHIQLDSAATHAYHTGDVPDPRARRTMRQHGMPIDDLKARPFTAADFARFDHILVADHNNYRHLAALAADDTQRAKIGYMLDTLPENPGAELPDPYYGGDSDFERTFALLHAALQARFAND